LASDDYFRICENLRQEIKEVHHQKFSKQQWSELNIVFFSKHQFYTKFAKENWQPIKEKMWIKSFSHPESERRKKKKAAEDNDKALLNKKKLEKLKALNVV
jgi:DNA mismatch repair ATPase MutS